MNVPADPAARGTVLVVDDSAEMLHWLTDTLEAEGYAVRVARSGEEALERLEFLVPDAVLLDAMMPGLSGFETCRRIKADPGWSHIPVIFMTGLSETGDIVRGFDSGGVDYVVKPLRAEEVLVRLATHLRNARVVRMAREAVDVGGRGALLLDSHGRISWCSPRAQDWLASCFASSRAEPPAAWVRQVLQLEAGQEAIAGADSVEQWVACSLGRAGLDETMLLLERRPGPGGGTRSVSARIDSAALTPRETEVLSWLAKGKTNRDIAEILGMSPRTVNKHLEHVFEKLGVETRAAAAALASRALG
jgi:DNA-binding NarL/FixJ family response regulator